MACVERFEEWVRLSNPVQWIHDHFCCEMCSVNGYQHCKISTKVREEMKERLMHMPWGVVLHIRPFNDAATLTSRADCWLLTERLKFLQEKRIRLRERYNRPASGANLRNTTQRAELWELEMEDFEVDDTEPSSHADVGGEEQYENNRVWIWSHEVASISKGYLLFISRIRVWCVWKMVWVGGVYCHPKLSHPWISNNLSSQCLTMEMKWLWRSGTGLDLLLDLMSWAGKELLIPLLKIWVLEGRKEPFINRLILGPTCCCHE